MSSLALRFKMSSDVNSGHQNSFFMCTESFMVTLLQIVNLGIRLIMMNTVCVIRIWL